MTLRRDKDGRWQFKFLRLSAEELKNEIRKNGYCHYERVTGLPISWKQQEKELRLMRKQVKTEIQRPIKLQDILSHH